MLRAHPAMIATVALLHLHRGQQGYFIIDPLSADSYRLYRKDDARIAFKPFMLAIPLVA